MYFSQSTYRVNEDDGTVQFVLVLNTSIAVSVTVQIESNDITAISEYTSLIVITFVSNLTGGNDYDYTLQSVTIPPGEVNASFSVMINSDNILEHEEDFTLTIASTSQPRVTVNGSGQATVNIVDDDGKQILTLCTLN